MAKIKDINRFNELRKSAELECGFSVEDISKERRKEINRKYMEKYRKRPEVKEYLKNYQKKYYQRPEVKEHRRAYYKRYMKEYCKRPEVKEYRRKYYKQKYLKLKELKEEEVI